MEVSAPGQKGSSLRKGGVTRGGVKVGSENHELLRRSATSQYPNGLPGDGLKGTA